MWRGSLYKLIYRELVIFLLAFDILSVLYRNLFTKSQQEVFEEAVRYCDEFIKLIPLTFILGFYVAYVAARWWQQYEAIPWPDKCMHTIALYISGNEEHMRIIRRTLMRYLNLTLVLVLRSISSAVKKRFPSLDHLTEVGFMTPSEKQIFLAVPNNEFNTYWIPCAWFIHVLKDTKAENPNLDSMGVKLIMEEFNEFRAKCGLLWSYDWISIPLVYTQVVTLATYSFFIAAVVGRQYVGHENKPTQMPIDIYLPVFTILQFLFFMGLLKVAEQLINPFGDDDEDFELNWLIDRHTKVSYLGVDTLMQQRPPLMKDKYFDDADLVLPYTSASVIHKKRTFRGSVHYMQVPEQMQDMYLPEIVEDEENDVSLITARRKSSIFTNPFQKRRISEEVENKDYRYAPEGIVNGKYKHSSLTPTISRKNSDHLLSNISVVSMKDSDSAGTSRRTVTKHNSLLYQTGRPGSKRINDKCKRRQSVPTLVRKTSSVQSGHSSSKWSLKRDSVLDAHWKGIRWKPFPKDDDHSAVLDVSALERKQRGDRFSLQEFAYTNPVFTQASESEKLNTTISYCKETSGVTSTLETREEVDNNGTSNENSKSTNENIDSNGSLQDSLV